jgi:hypothetical protein
MRHLPHTLERASTNLRGRAVRKRFASMDECNELARFSDLDGFRDFDELLRA